MERVGDVRKAEERLTEEIRSLLDEIRRLLDADVSSLDGGITSLSRLRNLASENLNQIQHEAALLRAITYLVAHDLAGQEVEWRWNPRQTGAKHEPDLAAVVDGKTVLSAECTSSALPKGMVDQRMAETLKTLNGMQGRRFYFVTGAEMSKRASTKIKKCHYDIEVVKV